MTDHPPPEQPAAKRPARPAIDEQLLARAAEINEAVACQCAASLVRASSQCR